MGVTSSPRSAQVIDLEKVRQRQQASRVLVRLSPETDNLEMVYQVETEPDNFYALPVLAWGLRVDNEVVGLIPWMETLTPCDQLDDEENSVFVGYRDPETQEMLNKPPEHKWHALTAAADYFDYEASNQTALIQQIPDHLGTYALCMEPADAPWQMKQVYAWNLYSDGSVDALVADDSQPGMQPILPGDSCLYPSRSRHPRVYFFQRHIANRIIQEDPETLEALALMVVPS